MTIGLALEGRSQKRRGAKKKKGLGRHSEGGPPTTHERLHVYFMLPWNPDSHPKLLDTCGKGDAGLWDPVHIRPAAPGLFCVYWAIR
eukprot:jgi/Mesen1/7958/ME000422S07119